MKKLIAGNWKMNMFDAEATALASELAADVSQNESKFNMVVCPPSIWLASVGKELKKSAIHLGGQDCHDKDTGAYTGNISAPMLANIDCAYVILGHSERRAQHNETDDLINQKAVAAHQAELITIICVGEQEADRDAGNHEAVVEQQLMASIPPCATAENTVIAYEPVWAIGTGKTATADDIASMHQFIRQQLSKKVDRADNMAILYGGSVKPANAGDILSTPNVDGVLVGGASLKAKDFLAIARAS